MQINNIPANNIPKWNVAFVIISDYNDALLSPKIHGKTLRETDQDGTYQKYTLLSGNNSYNDWKFSRRTLIPSRLQERCVTRWKGRKFIESGPVPGRDLKAGECTGKHSLGLKSQSPPNKT